jgi:Ras-related GTP-binding protein A/B
MGKHASGKTSMRSVVFANFLAHDTSRLGPTMNVEHAHVRFLNDLVLNLWDCGGQDRFYKSYFESQRDHIFRNVEMLVYVFDVKSVDEKDLQYYEDSLNSLYELSPSSQVFVLIHKIDPKDGDETRRRDLFSECEQRVLARSTLFPKARCFPTSIFDDTLVRAWSAVVEALVPNLGIVHRMLQDFLEAIDADEVVLFERATLLVVTHATRGTPVRDMTRFQKLSMWVKMFRTSCSSSQTSCEAIEVKSEGFTCVLDRLTDATIVLIMFSSKGNNSPEKLAAYNLEAARPAFEKALSA